MSILTYSSQIPDSVRRGSSLTIGNFDGVHKGHHSLIQLVRERAAEQGLCSMAVTFHPHPMRVLKGKTPPFLTPTKQKLDLLKERGLDFVLCLEFTRELASLSPEDFVYQYLVQILSCKWLIVGHDYTFGRGGAGDYSLLMQLGEKYGFHTEQIEAVTINGDVVSSTRIRELIQEGRVEEAAPLLGRCYRIAGKVIEGSRRGGPVLNIPTANLEPVDELIPASGVYAVWADHAGIRYPAVANVGHNPTFNQKTLSVEVHILDFSQDIYGDQLRVSFVRRLRGERRFSGIEDLKDQIGRDIEEGRRVLGEAGSGCN